MTRKIMLGAIIAIAVLAGTITTGTLANAAKPNIDGDAMARLKELYMKSSIF